MRTYMITVCHMKPEIIYYSIARALRTMDEFHWDRWIFVDNYYPIEKDKTREMIHRLATTVDAEVITPEKNVGGHGGSNLALQHLNPEPNDLVCFYDPEYNKWKGLHASGIFPGNFDEYIVKSNLHEYETPRTLS